MLSSPSELHGENHAGALKRERRQAVGWTRKVSWRKETGYKLASKGWDQPGWAGTGKPVHTACMSKGTCSKAACPETTGSALRVVAHMGLTMCQALL